MKRVAFICVHNSCRSQMAEAIANIYASDAFLSYSAGTEIKQSINKDAVAIIKRLFNVDMEATQKPKLISALPPVDIVITMGCHVKCPILPCSYREDWGLDDPTGKGEEAFLACAKKIEELVIALKQRIKDC